MMIGVIYLSRFIGGAIGHEIIGGFAIPNWDISAEEEVNLFFKKIGFESDKDYNACYPKDSDKSEIIHRYDAIQSQYGEDYGGGFHTIEDSFGHVEEISDWFYCEFRDGRTPMIYPQTCRFTEDYLDEGSEFWFWFCEDWNESLIGTMKTSIHRLSFDHDYISDNIYDDEDYYEEDDDDYDDDNDELDDEIDDDEYDEDDYDSANDELIDWE